MSPDLTNGLFELVGALFAWINAWKLFKDQEIKGVYWPIWIFYTSWGGWNLYYYPSLNQYISFWCGVILTAGNLMWVVMAIYLKCKKYFK